MKINFLYTSIGRGHPMYLDGIRACLPKQRIGSVEDVFSVSSPIPRMVWTLARTLYTRASSKGGGRSLYTRLRRSNNYNTPGPAMRLLG
ncbi:MAG: hypothetical protein EOM20_12755, partial [Spartobacteria bacterium]|nr:hypothetical protein [Spartobacteria bacterium]